jgi:hypothetical protein
LLQDDTAGDPVRAIKWTRKTLRKVAEQLGQQGFTVGYDTVRRLMRGLGYKLRVNRKRLSRRKDANRDRQMRYIFKRRKQSIRAGIPVISVDCKHRELVGNFKNDGRTWRLQPLDVMDSDYPSDAEGIAIPYGIYDIAHNEGFVVVGTSAQTPEFAVNAIKCWWRKRGCVLYPDQTHINIEADGGNPNSFKSWRFKYALQQFADEYQLTITVTHYPTGASKWNPIEHRLFSAISGNWQGQPLASYEIILKHIRTTSNDSGLRCKAYMDTRVYKTGQPLTQIEMSCINLYPLRIFPLKNYTIRPMPV